MDRQNKMYRSSYVPIRNRTVSDVCWAEYVRKEDKIRSKWLEEFGSRERQMPVQASPGHTQGVGAGLEAKAPKTPYGYPVPAHTAKPHVVKDHVPPYSSSLGHHSVQFGDQNKVCVKKPTSTNDFDLEMRSSQPRDGALQTKHPGELKPESSLLKSSGVVTKKPGLPYKLDGPVNPNKLGIEQARCTWDALQRQLHGIPPVEICCKCGRPLCCARVPRQQEKVPEGPVNVPNQKLPLCLPVVWRSSTYRGSRVGTSGDTTQLCGRLTKDPETQTPVNRLCDQMKALKFAGDKARYAHAPEKSIVCRTAREATCETRFDEQLKKGNPFTKGGTQHKSCTYMRKG